jgi:hypothetical protein
VVEQASAESIDLYVYLGKDDDDDDNDGKPDDKDTGDANGDGKVNEQDMADVIDLDEEIPDMMDNYPDKDKKTGIYIYVEDETGSAAVFVSDADSLEEASAKNILPGGGFFQRAAFAFRGWTSSNSKPVAKKVAEKTTPSLLGLTLLVPCDTTYDRVIKYVEETIKHEVTKPGPDHNLSLLIKKKSNGVCFTSVGSKKLFTQDEIKILQEKGQQFFGHHIYVEYVKFSSPDSKQKTDSRAKKQYK